MKINYSGDGYSFITDNTKELNENSAFCLTSQNTKFLESAKTKTKYILKVDDLLKLFGLNEIKIVGVTGTNGKTTTTAGIYSILLDLNKKVALQGTRGFYINDEKIEEKSLTTPSIMHTISHLIEAKDRDCEYFIMEVSSHAIAQNRIEGLNFSLRVFTNISQDHLDYHKNMAEYTKIKSSFFDNDDLKLINKDGGKIEFNIKNCYTYALETSASFKVNAYTMTKGTQFVIQHFQESVIVNSSLAGVFNIYNLLASIASVKLITTNSLEQIAQESQYFAGVSGRMQIVNEEPLIIVDFAHTPDGMDNVLKTIQNPNIIVVFGAGGNRDRQKRPQMGIIAQKYAKKIYITSDNPRDEEPIEIIKDIMSGMIKKDNIYPIEDRKEAITKAIKEADKNDTILILGKGDEEYQEIKGEFFVFDDREVVKEVLQSIKIV